MTFVVHWLLYMLAFFVGSVVAWIIASVTISRTSEEQAIADLPGSRQIGAR
jgi:uncharacterized membrane protein ArfB